MKTICLYFEIHQIIHLKRYRFFDVGTDHYYYDDYENERSISDIAERSYTPALTALEDMIRRTDSIQGSFLYLWCGYGAVGTSCATGVGEVAGPQQEQVA